MDQKKTQRHTLVPFFYSRLLICSQYNVCRLFLRLAKENKTPIVLRTSSPGHSSRSLPSVSCGFTANGFIPWFSSSRISNLPLSNAYLSVSNRPKWQRPITQSHFSEASNQSPIMIDILIARRHGGSWNLSIVSLAFCCRKLRPRSRPENGCRVSKHHMHVQHFFFSYMSLPYPRICRRRISETGVRASIGFFPALEQASTPLSLSHRRTVGKQNVT